MDIREAYFMTTGHMDGNYNKIGKRLYDKTQSIGEFFTNVILQRICDYANSEQSGRKADILDMFLLTIHSFGDVEEFIKYVKSSTKPGYEQIDDFLYSVCPDHEMYNKFNKQYGFAEKRENYDFLTELFKNPEIRTVLGSYIRYIGLSNAENAEKIKQCLYYITYVSSEKIDKALEKKMRNKDAFFKKMYEDMWFSLSEKRIDKYDSLEKLYFDKLSEIKEKENKIVNLKQRRMDKLVDLYNFKSKTKGIFDGIVGQREQLKQIMQALYNAQLGLNNIDGPRASMLLTGPTGVGKTETAFAISNSLFGKDPFVIDLSVYRGDHQLSTLIGSPPGYVGYNDKPAFLEYIKANAGTGGVLLFDEFDKANPQVLNIFMHMLDKGEVQSAKGQSYSVKNFVVITTSNITEKINRHIGFGTEEESIKNTISSNAVGSVPPELIARFDLVIAYSQLSKEEKMELARRKMDIVCAKIGRLKDFLNVKIKYDEKVLEELANSVNESMGVRELFRDVNNLATKKLVEYIMEHDDFTDFAIYIRSLNDIVVKALPKTKKSEELKKAVEQKLLEQKLSAEKEDDGRTN